MDPETGLALKKYKTFALSGFIRFKVRCRPCALGVVVSSCLVVQRVTWCLLSLGAGAWLPNPHLRHAPPVYTLDERVMREVAAWLNCCTCRVGGRGAARVVWVTAVDPEPKVRRRRVCVLPSYFSYIRLLTVVVLLLCWWTCARGAQAGADEAITELVAKADA